MRPVTGFNATHNDHEYFKGNKDDMLECELCQTAIPDGDDVTTSQLGIVFCDECNEVHETDFLDLAELYDL